MKTAIWIIVALLILGGVWWYFAMPPASTTPTATGTGTDVTGMTDQTQTGTATNTSATTTSTGTTGAAPMTANVIYSAQGFAPSTVTIANGGTVTWVNQSGSQLWIASDPHPTHEGYSGTTRTQHCPDTAKTALDECAPSNGGFSFTFKKTGTWGYHNHMNSSDRGTVIVQ